MTHLFPTPPLAFPMSYTMEAVDQTLAEGIARQMLRYQDIVFTHKAIISRLNPDEVQESVERIGQMLQITAWWHHPLSEDDADEFLLDCDQLCSTPPESLVDRLKILYGAWTALNYILISVAPTLPRGTWKAAQRRYYELAQQRFPFRLACQATPLHLRTTRPPGKLRPLTEIERESYKNPENILGKQFVLFPGTENEMVYKVVEYTRAEDESLKYTVLFHDCDDFPMEEHEVASQLAYSLIYAD